MVNESAINKVVAMLEARQTMDRATRWLDEMVATTVYGEPRRSGTTGGPWVLHWWDGGVGYSEAPRFTSSLDAGIPGEHIHCVLQMGDGRWEAEAMSNGGDYYKAEANTEAMARRAAALKARMAP